MATAIANAQVLKSGDASEADKSAALEMIKELAPALAAIELHHHID